MKKTVKIMTAVLFVVVLLCGMTNRIGFAAEAANIVETYTENDSVVLYVSGIEGELQEISYQMGNTPCEVTSYQTIGQQDTMMYTLILWDNSISVMRNYGDTVKEILLDIVANRAPGEKFSIVTLEKDITVLSDYTDDYAVLKQSINSVEKVDKSVYIIENLYHCLEELNAMADSDFKRVILISDGSGEAETGYTATELERLLSSHSYPIYSIGVGKDEAGLQYMFSLSRTTGAGAYHVDKLEDSLEVSESIKEHYKTLQVVAKIPEELLDGSNRNSKLSVVTTAGTYEAQCQIKLPFLSEIEKAEPTPEPTPEPTEAPEPTATPEPTKAPTKASEKTLVKLSVGGIAVVGGILLVIVLIIVIVCVAACKKKSPKEVPAAKTKKADPMETEALYKDEETQSLFDNNTTEILSNMNTDCRFQITAVDDAAVMFRCNISTEKVKIGRKAGVCNIALADKAVSGEHCEVYARSGKIYIRDLGSSNGTFVDGRKIDSETELRTGTILKLGKTEYRVMIG